MVTKGGSRGRGGCGRGDIEVKSMGLTDTTVYKIGEQ